MTDSSDLDAAKRLMDAAKRDGFEFSRIAPGEDGPLRGVRQTERWFDEVYISGFSSGCTALRRPRSSLLVPGGPPVSRRVDGSALTVLYAVVSDWLV